MIGQLFRRSTFLTLVQIISALVPLLLIPLANETLGTDRFSKVLSIMALFNIAAVVIDFGMTSPAIRALSNTNRSTSLFYQTIATVFTIRLLSLLFQATFLGVYLTFYYTGDVDLMYAALLIPIAAVFNPYFLAVSLGYEKRYALFVVAARIAQLIIALILWPMLPVDLLFFILTAGLLTVFYLVFILTIPEKIGPYRPHIEPTLLRDSFLYLQSKIVVSIYKNLPLIIFGLGDVGGAAIAFHTLVRIVDAFVSFINPLASIAINMSDNGHYPWPFVVKSSLIVLLASAIAYLFLLAGFDAIAIVLPVISPFYDLALVVGLLLIIVPLGSLFLNGFALGSGSIPVLRFVYLKSLMAGTALFVMLYVVGVELVVSVTCALVLIETLNTVQGVNMMHRRFRV